MPQSPRFAGLLFRNKSPPHAALKAAWGAFCIHFTKHYTAKIPLQWGDQIWKCQEFCANTSTGSGRNESQPAAEASSKKASSHPLLSFSPGTSIARWENQLSAMALCQCLISAEILTTSPGWSAWGFLPHS